MEVVRKKCLGWFVSGMVLCIFSVNVSNKAKKGVAVGIVFLAMSGLLLRGEVPNLTSSFLLGVLACASVILMTKAYQDNLAENCVFKFMSKYTMPVFLMHTICAAPTRSILFKIGITSAWIHIKKLFDKWKKERGAESSLLRSLCQSCHIIVVSRNLLDGF